MWIVRVALNRPYTFVVLALLILGIGPLTISRTPTDIFPNINIPVVTRHLELRRPVRAGDGRSHHLELRAHADDVGQRHRARRVAVAARHCRRQDLPAAERQRSTWPSRRSRRSSQAMLRQAPLGTLPPFILQYNASSVPIIQLALSGQGLSRAAAVRPRRQLPAAVSSRPSPARSCRTRTAASSRRCRWTSIRRRCRPRGLAPADVVNAIAQQNLILPAGTSKIGAVEYDVDLNAQPADDRRAERPADQDVAGRTPIYIRDVAHVRNGYPPQTNIARVDGQRAVLMIVQKVGNASTLDVIKRIKAAGRAQALPRLPPALTGQAARRPVAVRPRLDRRACCARP